MLYNDFETVVPKVSNQRKYYFIRTDHGRYFDEFYENGFVAIGWDPITLDDLKRADTEEVRLKVGRIKERHDIEDSIVKREITSILNKLLLFRDMNVGDIVVMPSYNSDRFAFGRVLDPHVYLENDNRGECPHIKRRRVEWVSVKNKNRLHPDFSLIRAHHAIFDISSDYSSRIDSLLSSVYQKDDYTYLRIDVGIEEEIPIQELIKIFNSIDRLAEEFRVKYPDFGEVTVKVNLNSPGDIGVKIRSSVHAMAFAFVLFTACTQDQVDSRNVSDQVVDIEPGIDQKTIENAVHSLQETRRSLNARMNENLDR
ncbi:hypothetical protein [Phaeocystidibacter marisrubri]|uniref:Uncharacterized protein n=1 Tax=Phaeocystidibacter marisrubri TaxID=1577780 RepID=A0A6L3ZKF3_9FLAO|nr:hypothetical protein [Phaeocystidibacter marisrubri]KAB2818129.1 hypothetical protein F8C82_06920 [Phaeocystidibacter marisrubri]GGH71806.1 hypothetical protein GCM10011318_15140 [Phaeocystidibacter marisrubri]